MRVVCLFLSDIDRVGNLIRNAFSILNEDNKIEGTDVSSFGYMSVHFIAKMKVEYSGPRYDSISKIPFEIQVRTIAMDAWANVSHYLDYKSDEDVPSELRRDFYALSGLFYVADKHFELFYGSSRKSQEKMAELFDDAPPHVQRSQEINLDSLAAYLNKKFSDRRHANAISHLVKQLRDAGYTSIEDIENAIEKGWDAFSAYESKNRGKPAYYADVAIIRIIFNLIDENFLNLGDSYPAVVLKRLAEARKLLKNRGANNQRG